MEHYVQQFHPRMVGLTGAPGQVASMAKSFRVYFTDVDKSESGDDEDYLGEYEHTSLLIHPTTGTPAYIQGCAPATDDLYDYYFSDSM